MGVAAELGVCSRCYWGGLIAAMSKTKHHFLQTQSMTMLCIMTVSIVMMMPALTAHAQSSSCGVLIQQDSLHYNSLTPNAISDDVTLELSDNGGGATSTISIKADPWLSFENSQNPVMDVASTAFSDLANLSHDQKTPLSETFSSFVDVGPGATKNVFFSVSTLNMLESDFTGTVNQEMVLRISCDSGVAEHKYDDWFDDNWAKRIPLTINPQMVPSTQDNFPMLVDSVFPSLIDTSKDQIRFALPNKTALDYEIEEFDETTGKLVAWVKQPKLYDNLKTYIYFENPDADDGQNASAVWDDSFTGVYHLGDDGALVDSTKETQTFNSDTTSMSVSAKIGKGKSYDGSISNYDTERNFEGFASDKITAEMWVKPTAGVENKGSIVSYAASPENSNAFLIYDQNALRVYVNGIATKTKMDLVSDEESWRHLVVQWSLEGYEDVKKNFLLKVYVDGNFQGSFKNNNKKSITDGGTLVLGQDQDSDGFFDTHQAYPGLLDELRFSSTIKSADWIKTSYNSYDTGAFYDIGIMQSGTGN